MSGENANESGHIVSSKMIQIFEFVCKPKRETILIEKQNQTESTFRLPNDIRLDDRLTQFNLSLFYCAMMNLAPGLRSHRVIFTQTNSLRKRFLNQTLCLSECVLLYSASKI